MQINQSQKPIELLNLCEKVFRALNHYSDGDQFFYSMMKVRSFTKEKLEQILENVKNLESSESSIRAEFRFELNASSSMFALVDNIFSDEFINQHSLALSMEDVCNLTRFWLIFLFTPIFDCLSHINGELQFNHAAMSLLERYVPTISVFESLLEHTLFGGSFKSYLSKSVWSNKRTEEFNSLMLEDTIRKLNRLNFSGSAWDSEFKLISGSNDLFELFLQKYKFKKANFVRESYQLMARLDTESKMSVKAHLLWESYFGYLWNKFPNDFNLGKNNFNIYSIENVNFSKSVFALRDAIGQPEACARIFDLKKLDNQKGALCWNLPYLVCYEGLLKNNPHIKDELDFAILGYAYAHIEYIHEAGARYRFFKNGPHYFIKVSAFPEITSNRVNINALNVPRAKRNNFKKSFSLIECENLCIGLNYFKYRSTKYSKIFKSKQLGFNKNYPLHSSRIKRNNLHLKRMHDQLLSNNELVLDQSTGNLFYTKSTLKACSPRTDLNYSECDSSSNEEMILEESNPLPLLNTEIEKSSAESNRQKLDQFVESLEAYHAIDDSYFVNNNLFELENSLSDYKPRISDTSVTENDSTEFWIESYPELIPNYPESPIKIIKRLLEIVGIEHFEQYYNAICFLPMLGSSQMGQLWPKTISFKVSKPNRDYVKGRNLLELLIREKLVELMAKTSTGKIYKRYFRTFKIITDA